VSWLWVLKCLLAAILLVFFVGANSDLTTQLSVTSEWTQKLF